MDEIKLFRKNWKGTGNSNIHSEHIQSGHRSGIWHRTTCHACDENWQTTPDGRNGTTKSRQD